jgi:hypothetical protein
MFRAHGEVLVTPGYYFPTLTGAPFTIHSSYWRPSY